MIARVTSDIMTTITRWTEADRQDGPEHFVCFSDTRRRRGIGFLRLGAIAAVQRRARYHAHLHVTRQFQHQPIIDEMQRTIQRTQG